MGWGWRSFPKWCCEGQARDDEGDRCGDVLGEETTHKKKNIGEINLFFFFIEPSAMHQRVFLSLYVKRLRKKFYFCCTVLAALGTLKELGLPCP